MRVFVCVLTLAAAAWGRGRLPVAFEPNRGQEPGGTDYVARGLGYRVALTAGHAELAAGQAHLTAVLAGSRAQAKGEPEERLPGIANYYPGWDPASGITGIPTYARVRYRSVYPGIDLVYYGKEGRLEFDFVVAPGSDPRAIRMRYEGARGLRVDSAGDLVLETAGGSLRQHRPVVYQEIGGQRREVAGRYRLRGKTVGFEVAKYDRGHALIIDPALTWATFFGGSSTDTTDAVAVDSSGNIYITGATADAYGYRAVYFSKLNSSGTEASSTTTFVLNDDDAPHGIALDSGGNIWIVGESNVYSYYGLAYTDAFLAKFSPSGTKLFTTTFGGSGSQVAYGIALDSSSDAYVVGVTNSSDFPTGHGQTSPGGGTVDGFIGRFSSMGNWQYGSYLGGSGDEYATAVAVDSLGNAFVTGYTTSTNFPVTSSAYQQSLSGGNDVFLIKLSAAFDTQYSTYLGGAGDDYGTAVAVDSSGAAYVAGETTSADFPAVNAAQKQLKGTSDAFLAKLAGDGSSLQFSTYLGGGADEAAYGVALDGAGNAFLTGSTTSPDFPVADAFQKTLAGGKNAFVAAMSASGLPLFASYLGGSGTNGDDGSAVATGCSTGLVIVGTTTSSDFPATPGVVQTTAAGGASDGFVAQVPAAGMPTINADGVMNGANFQGGSVAPGSLLVLKGTGMAAGPLLASAMPLPAGLLGTTVTIGGRTAPQFYASSVQMNVQVPYETPPGPATVTITNPCGTSTESTFQVAEAAPYIFQLNQNDAIAYNLADNTLNTADNPAAPGTGLLIFLTGIGPLDNPVATGAGATASPLSRASLPWSATIGGAYAGGGTDGYLGLTPTTAGVAQANLKVPGGCSGACQVMVTVGGVATNGLNVYVK
jgi:uncharacterized protein (TIGR03437 family)